jgi:hypothetical protein
MATTVYGSSDDTIAFGGDVTGEVGIPNNTPPVLIVCSDGTLLTMHYGKGDLGIWCIGLLKPGSLFNGIVSCFDEKASPYSDVADFAAGLKWAYVATEWERVK